MHKKIDKKNREKYYLNLTARGNVYASAPTDMVVLFTDGTKWRDSYGVITSEKVGGGWVYRATTIISKREVKHFSTKTIDKFKIYVFENDISEEFGRLFLENIIDLIKAN